MNKRSNQASNIKKRSQLVKRKRFQYNKEHVSLALQEILNGKAIAEISRKYNIPETTLREKKSGKYANKRPGPSTILSAQEESDLVKWIFFCGKQGFPVTKCQLFESVQVLCNNDNRKTPFVNNQPGRSWYEGFLKRHTEISERISENVSLNRAKVSEHDIRSWFSGIHSYFIENNVFITDPRRIFNGDEIGVPMNPKPPAVLAPKGSKNVYNIVNNNEKENITVLVTGNAAGDLAPPLILFAGQSIPRNVAQVAPAGFSFGFSDNGWMTAKNFYEYVANVFCPWLETSQIQLPIILYIDGHSSHITLPLSQLCQEKQIILIALCPNSTHILQPLDVAFFRTLKMNWQQCNKSICQQSGLMSIKKCQFAFVLQKTFESTNVAQLLKSGFEICGLHPFNVDAVDFTKVFERNKVSVSKANNIEKTVNEISKSDHLKWLEGLIGDKKLRIFESTTSGTWTENNEDTSLFELWYNLVGTKKVNRIEKTENISDYNKDSSSMETPVESLLEGSFKIKCNNDEGELAVLSTIDVDYENIFDEKVSTENGREKDTVLLELIVDVNGNVINTNDPQLPAYDRDPSNNYGYSNIEIKPIGMETMNTNGSSSASPESLTTEIFYDERPVLTESKQITYSNLEHSSTSYESIKVKESHDGNPESKQIPNPNPEASNNLSESLKIEVFHDGNPASIETKQIPNPNPEAPNNLSEFLKVEVFHDGNPASIETKQVPNPSPEASNNLSEFVKVEVSCDEYPDTTESKLTSNQNPEIAEFSDAFQKLLFWPKCDLTKKKKRALNSTSVPSVLSSPQWQKIEGDKYNEKMKKQEDVILRKKIKLEKKEITVKNKEEKRVQREKERLMKVNIRLEKQKQQYLKQQQKLKNLEELKKNEEEALFKKEEKNRIIKQIEELKRQEAELNE